MASPDGRVAPRSGLASKQHIDVGAGVIDADYRGPVKVLLFNHGENDFKGEALEAEGTDDADDNLAVSVGDRVAQLIIERIYNPDVVVVEELEASVRGTGGFGSTG
ncbi:MAG: Deoxyuridine 5'-triphosphate nucleotidohydrolase [Caeruleum heppii]|nr:MAG: Deoxyuridine 5'-triphosphate nucleotidohydrolase [Caeruleum heppii]